MCRQKTVGLLLPLLYDIQKQLRGKMYCYYSKHYARNSKNNSVMTLKNAGEMVRGLSVPSSPLLSLQQYVFKYTKHRI